MIGSPDLKQALIKKQRQLEDDLDRDIKNLSTNLLDKVRNTFSASRFVLENEVEDINLDDLDGNPMDPSNSSNLRQRSIAPTIDGNNPAFELELDNLAAKSEVTANKVNLKEQDDNNSQHVSTAV